MSAQKATFSAVVFLGLAILLVGCDKHKARQHSQPSPKVSVATIHIRDIPLSYHYAAQITSVTQTEVRARVDGILLKRFFKEGQFVHQGDLLFEIEPSAYEAAVASAKAQVLQAQITFDDAQKAAKRAEELARQHVESKVVCEQMQVKRDVSAAQLKHAKANLTIALLNLSYTKVRAPISGYTSEQTASEGSLLKSASANNLLTTITQLDPVYINFSCSKGEARQLRKLWLQTLQENADSPKPYVKVELGDGTEYEKKGEIDFTSSVLDADNGTFAVRAEVANPNKSLAPGEFVRVKLKGLHLKEGIEIPEQALMQDMQGSYIFVVHSQATQEGKTIFLAKRQIVHVLQQLSNRNWVIENGPRSHPCFKEGDWVLTEGQMAVARALTFLGDKVPAVPVNVAAIDGRTAEKANATTLELNSAQTASGKGGK